MLSDIDASVGQGSDFLGYDGNDMPRSDVSSIMNTMEAWLHLPMAAESGQPGCWPGPSAPKPSYQRCFVF